MLTFYADLFLLTNWYMDVLTFYAIKKLFVRTVKIRRLLLVGLLESFSAMILVLLVREYVLYQLLCHFLVNPVCIYLLFRPEDKTIFLKLWLMAYLILLLLGGFMEWCQENTGLAGANTLLLGTLPVLALVVILGWRRQNLKTEVWVRIGYAGRETAGKAFLDSGNQLMDPFTGKEVHILSGVQAEKLLVPEEKCRWVPFHSVGREHGLLKVFTADFLILKRDQKEIRIAAPVIGISEEQKFLGRNYCMLLNAVAGELLQ